MSKTEVAVAWVIAAIFFLLILASFTGSGTMMRDAYGFRSMLLADLVLIVGAAVVLIALLRRPSGRRSS